MRSRKYSLIYASSGSHLKLYFAFFTKLFLSKINLLCLTIMQHDGEMP